MELNFDNLRLAIQAGYNLVNMRVEELVTQSNEGQFPSEAQIDDLRDNMIKLRDNIATLICCYGESEKINDISSQTNLLEVNFSI